MAFPPDNTDNELSDQPVRGFISPPPSWLVSSGPPASAPPLTIPEWLSASRPRPVVPPQAPGWLADIAQPPQRPPAGAPPSPPVSPPIFEAEPPTPEPEAPVVPTVEPEVLPAPEAEDELAALRAAAAPAGEVPDWLAETSEETAPPVPLPAAEVPEWLKAEAPPETAAPEILPAAPTPEPEAEVPEWMKELPAPPPAAEAPEWLKAEVPAEPVAPEIPPAAPMPEPEAEVPEWMKELPAAPPAVEAPEWLKAEAPAESGAPEIPTAPPEPEAKVPEWMKELPAPPPAAEAPVVAAAPEIPAAPMPEPAVPEEPAPPPPPLPVGGMPDWLKTPAPAETGGAPEKPSPPPAPAPEEVPDWLGALAAGEPEAAILAPAEPVTPPSPPAAEEVPDWLGALAAGEPEAAPPAPTESVTPPSPPAAEEVPDWLGALAAGEPEAAPPMPAEPVTLPSPPAAEEVPDWLGALAAGEPEAAPPTPTEPMTPPAPTPGEVPDWLGALATGEPEAAPPAPTTPVTPPPIQEVVPPLEPAATPPAAEPGGDLLDLLGADLGMPPTAESAPEAAGEDLLGLTGELVTPPAAEQPTEEAETAEEAMPALGELPEWLRGLKPADVEATPAAGETAISPELMEQIGGLKFDAIVGQEAPSAAPEKVGALKDIVGAIHPEVVFEGGAMRVGGLIGETLVSEEQSRRIQRLEELLKAEAVEVIPGRRGMALPLVRWLITLLLLAAIAAPTILGLSVLPAPQASKGSSDAQRLIADLPADAQVVVAFEYEPDAAAELQPLAVSLVRQLATHDKITIYAVSTRPIGPAMADSAFQQLSSLMTGTWINLGFIPGGANGISTLVTGSPRGLPSLLASDYRGQPTTLTQNGLSETPPDLIIVIAARSEDLRPWVEQAGEVMHTPILAATSAGSSPLAYPYRQTEQVVALMTGVGDTLGYQSLGDTGPDPALSLIWNAQAVGGLVAVLAIVIGGVFYGVVSRRQQEQGS